MLRSDYLNKPPVQGKKAVLGNSEALFLSTHGIDPIQAMPAEVTEFVLTQTPTYMDIGCAEIDHNIPLAVLSCIYPFLIGITVTGFIVSDPDVLLFWPILLGTMAVIMLIGLMIYYVVRRRHHATVRFYRQTQQVVFKPSPKSPFIEIDWHALMPYLKAGKIKGYNGYKWFEYDTSSLHLAWLDKESNTLHTFYRGGKNIVGVFALDEWNLIKRFMNGDGSNYTFRYKLVPNSETFKVKHENVWQAFVNNKHKRWFAFDIRNMSVSYLSIGIYYFLLMLGLWRIPYLFCDLYLALAVKPFLPKETCSSDSEYRGT